MAENFGISTITKNFSMEINIFQVTSWHNVGKNVPLLTLLISRSGYKIEIPAYRKFCYFYIYFHHEVK